MGQSHFIREWRKHRGLSQVQLAERVQINQGNLSRIEKGTRKYDQEFLERAADALGCEPADLLKVDPKAQASEEIWDFYDKMSSTQKAQVVEIAKALLKVS
ncbi:helix-turn-helix domain-containing protein [Caulobacter sp. FWC2]|uniref:helix-turn-helix domain-containing protein n=1 Tax=Caulobacter sp. FWC2 TaxID=69664 RepID=UPI00130416AD|nr:helix-turn-helix transcriptional regulator [Caulobacter sp. FWC2]